MSVDGRPAHLGQKVDPGAVSIAVDGIPLPVAPDLRYYLVYKPPGVVSTAADTHGRPTVVDLVPGDVRVYPVGRLDIDSEGLMILTNDGDLTLRLTHPRYGVPKTYVALVDGVPTPGELRRLVEGVELDDAVARADSARILDRLGDRALVEVVMREGRKREVRRMFDAVGHEVRRLTRVAIGPLVERDLPPGRSRPLRLEEVRALYAAATEPGS